MEPKRYYRSTTEKVFAGVCGGLAEYFAIDPLLVRLIFVILALAGGGGVLIYILLWIVTPVKPFNFNQTTNQTPPVMENQHTNQDPDHPAETPNKDPFKDHRPIHRNRGNLIGGLVLITLGAIFLADSFIPHIRFEDLWPLILVVIGIGLLINSVTGKRKNS